MPPKQRSAAPLTPDETATTQPVDIEAVPVIVPEPNEHDPELVSTPSPVKPAEDTGAPRSTFVPVGGDAPPRTVGEQNVDLQRRNEVLEAENAYLREQLDEVRRMLADYQAEQYLLAQPDPGEGRIVTPTNPNAGTSQVRDMPPTTLGGPSGLPLQQ